MDEHSPLIARRQALLEHLTSHKNLETRLGALDLCFAPAGFPRGHDDLRPQATLQPVPGTSVVLPISRLADVEHSKRIAARVKVHRHGR